MNLDTKPYTMEEFGQKHGLTYQQLKGATNKRRVDCEIIPTRERRKGGAKRQTVIYETERTLKYITWIKGLNLIPKRKNIETHKTPHKRYEEMILSYNNM